MEDRIPELQLYGFDPEKFEVDIKPLLEKAVSETEDGRKQFECDHKFSGAVADALMKIRGDAKTIHKILSSIFRLFNKFVEEFPKNESSCDPNLLLDKFIERWIDALEMIIHKLLYKMYAECGPYYISDDFYQKELAEFIKKLDSYQVDERCIDLMSQDTGIPLLLAVSRGTEQIDKILSAMRTNRNFRPPHKDYPNGDPTDLVNTLADIITRLATMKQPGAGAEDPQIMRIINSIGKQVH